MLEIIIKLDDTDLGNLEIFHNDENCIKDFIVETIKEKINFIQLYNGFRFNILSRELYDGNEKKVVFTRKERVLFNYLMDCSIKNENSFVDIETIKKNVWNRNETTIFSIRNKIFSIRNKTFSEIIINKSKLGYRINLKNYFINLKKLKYE